MIQYPRVLNIDQLSTVDSQMKLIQDTSSFFSNVVTHSEPSYLELFIYSIFDKILLAQENQSEIRHRGIESRMIMPQVREQSYIKQIPIFIGEVILVIFYVMTMPFQSYKIEQDKSDLEHYRAYWINMKDQINENFYSKIITNFKQIGELNRENIKVYNHGRIERIICLASSIFLFGGLLTGNVPLIIVSVVPVVITGIILIFKRRQYIAELGNFEYKTKFLENLKAYAVELQTSQTDTIFV